jgi:HTH-type transcriptional regulator, sugar sensing transcriptional regulator
MAAKNNDVIASLESLGLSTYESKAYLAAIGQPPITSYRLAQRSGVPRARIYEIVEKLAAKGLLVFQSGNRTLLAAADYEKFLDKKEAESRENFDRLRKSLAAIPASESPGIWNIEGRSRVLQTARDLLSSATRYVYLEALAEDVRELMPILQKIRLRKIEIHGIYCGDLAEDLPGLVRHLGENASGCSEIAAVVDGEQALLGCTQPENSASVAMTQNKGIIQIAREYIRHEVFLNTHFGDKDPTAEERYIRKYRNLMRRLP